MGCLTFYEASDTCFLKDRIQRLKGSFLSEEPERGGHESRVSSAKKAFMGRCKQGGVHRSRNRMQNQGQVSHSERMLESVKK